MTHLGWSPAAVIRSHHHTLLPSLNQPPGQDKKQFTTEPLRPGPTESAIEAAEGTSPGAHPSPEGSAYSDAPIAKDDLPPAPDEAFAEARSDEVSWSDVVTEGKRFASLAFTKASQDARSGLYLAHSKIRDNFVPVARRAAWTALSTGLSVLSIKPPGPESSGPDTQEDVSISTEEWVTRWLTQTQVRCRHRR